MKTLLLAALAAASITVAGCGVQDDLTTYLGVALTYEKHCGKAPMDQAMQTFLNRVGQKKLDQALAALNTTDIVFVHKAQEQHLAQIGETEWCRQQYAQWFTQFGPLTTSSL